MSETKVNLFLNCPFFTLKFVLENEVWRMNFKIYLLCFAKLLLFQGSMYQWFDILSEVAVKRKHSQKKFAWLQVQLRCVLWKLWFILIPNFGNRVGKKFIIVSFFTKWRWSHRWLNGAMRTKIGLNESQALVTETISQAVDGSLLFLSLCVNFLFKKT